MAEQPRTPMKTSKLCAETAALFHIVLLIQSMRPTAAGLFTPKSAFVGRKGEGVAEQDSFRRTFEVRLFLLLLIQ